MLSSAPMIEDQVAAAIPLVVDLDGTLIRSDLLVESFFQSFGDDWLAPAALLRPLLRGKAQLKAAIADRTEIDPSELPYDEAVLARIRAAISQGRKAYLASASHERYVAAIAAHLGLFSGWFASDMTRNLSGPAKAARLVEAFGQHGFDYIGNDEADLPVWAAAATPIGIRVAPGTRRRLSRMAPQAEFLPSERASLTDWLKLIRVHQYAKNALIFIPLLTAQKFQAASFLIALTAFIAFSLCASGVYILNDLVDLAADRCHPTKKNRPLAAGTIPPFEGIVAACLLLCSAVIIGATVSPMFLGVLVAYFALTSAYTFALKRKMLVDVIVLAMLYTIRVIGGAAAVDVPMSEWLLGFSMFIFTALALIKRYTELSVRLDGDLPDPSNRNYKIGDLPIVATLAAAAGFNAVTVFALYISSDTVHRLYRHPLLLWLICPILMYWIGRALMLAHRRMMHDDPIVFALKDWRSRVCVGMVGLILLAAI
ncbi:4-hydroxybenzoate polyprenyltransferase [Rhizobiales bacterium GAS191]|nr:4-hydroxybenzoate polyprenyltransferase [Rhizobiales bacterium GAS191]